MCMRMMCVRYSGKKKVREREGGIECMYVDVFRNIQYLFM